MEKFSSWRAPDSGRLTGPPRIATRPRGSVVHGGHGGVLSCGLPRRSCPLSIECSRTPMPPSSGPVHRKGVDCLPMGAVGFLSAIQPRRLSCPPPCPPSTAATTGTEATNGRAARGIFSRRPARARRGARALWPECQAWGWVRRSAAHGPMARGPSPWRRRADRSCGLTGISHAHSL